MIGTIHVDWNWPYWLRFWVYDLCAQVMMLWTKRGHNHYIFHNYINIINPIVRPAHHGLQDRTSTEGNCEIHLAWIWKVLISWALVKSRMFVDLTWHGLNSKLYPNTRVWSFVDCYWLHKSRSMPPSVNQLLELAGV